MSSLAFGFKDLVNSYPTGKSIFDLSSLLINDKQIKTFNPTRYNFYIKFMNGLSNPKSLEQFFYKIKEAKLYKEELNDKLAKFADLIKKLNISVSESDAKKIKEGIIDTVKNRYNLSDNVTSKLNDMMSGGAQFLNKGDQPMQNFITTVNSELPQISSKSIKSVNDLLIETQDDNTSDIRTQTKAEIISKAEKIYNSYKDDVSLDKFKITTADRVVFIVTTFIIRFFTLLIIQWGLDTNLITSFHTAFNYYCFIYLLFFAFITTFVNVIIAYPIIDLFSNSSIANVPNLFYYFYIYTNGSIRLILHVTFILIILFIPYIISIDKYILKRSNEPVNISKDQDKKKKIYDTISLFSIIIWIMTSIIAYKF